MINAKKKINKRTLGNLFIIFFSVIGLGNGGKCICIPLVFRDLVEVFQRFIDFTLIEMLLCHR